MPDPIPAEWIDAGTEAVYRLVADRRVMTYEQGVEAILAAVLPMVREEVFAAVREALEEQIHHAKDNGSYETRPGFARVPVVRADYIDAAIDGVEARIARGGAR